MDQNQDLTKNYLYCPPDSFQCLPLVRTFFRRYPPLCWPQLKGTEVIYFYQGRVALSFLCKLWQLKSDGEILLPAYNCGTEIDPFVVHGTKVIFYRVGPRAQIDQNDIKKRCTSKTQLVYITHYFGWAHEVGPLYRWCRERGIYVVEDCALSLFSSSDEGPLGTLADASIFSFRKFLPVPDGAALVLNRTALSSAPRLIKPKLSKSLVNLLPFCKSSAMHSLDTCGFYQLLRKLKLKKFESNKFKWKETLMTRPGMPRNYYFNKDMENWSMTSFSHRILQQFDPELITQRRRKNYLHLLENIRNLPSVTPLYDTLPQGVCPLALYVKIPKRSIVCKHLNAYGIASLPWWEGYHRQFSWDNFDDSKNLKNTLLYLPINQNLNDNQIEYISKIFHDIISKI